jgi:DNA replication protein DnaC
MNSEKTYIGEDGLTHCSVCKKPLEVEIYVPMLKRKMKYGCICDCKKKEIEARKEQERQDELDRKRYTCFGQVCMKDWNFANDDRKNAKLSDAMKKYADNFKDFLAESKGLLLYGTVGTGKTYYAACIANQLIDSGYDVLMTNFATLTNKMQGTFDGKQEYIDSLNRYKLLIIDDLGAERKSEYMQELIYNLIDSRYRSGLPMIITTNLSADEIKRPGNMDFARIYDRVLERCLPIAVQGESRRRRAVIDNYSKDMERLGLS